MKNGLHILCIRAGYNPYVVIGWFRQSDFVLAGHGVRVIRRFGRLGELQNLAQKGPIKTGSKTQLLAAGDEDVPLCSVARIIPCDPKAWADECPRPDGWES